MNRIVVNKLKDLVRKWEALKKGRVHARISLDEQMESVAALHHGSNTDILSNPFELIELRMDLSKTLLKLTPQQQLLCRLLGEGGLTVKEASACLNVPRTSLYDQIKRIRAFFEKESLGDYLKESSDTF